MEIIPIKTRLFTPPQDHVFTELVRALPNLQEKDIVVISSKVVAIHEGRCVPVAGTDKKALIAAESDFLISREYWSSPLSVIHNTFIGNAGIDESNAGGYYILLPEDPCKSAMVLLGKLRREFSVKEIGIIITDSHSTPMRRGAVGVSIGYAGFAPTKSLVGEKDLFGRTFKVEVANIVDAIAAAANLVMGEGRECQPCAIVRGLSDINFTDDCIKHEHMVPYREDTFRVLYERYLP